MDLQRFALVPVNAPGARTQWDTRWGTCMNDNQFMDCEHDANANAPPASASRRTPTRSREEGAPDQTVVAFPNRIPNGSYQLVAISNPYGAIREAGTTYGSVSCVSLQVSGDAEVGEWRVYQAGATPTNCLLPTNIPGALTGPGGTDPFAGANPAAACNPLLITGHCWDTIPVDGAHPIAHTNVRDTSTAPATRTVAQYGAVGTYGRRRRRREPRRRWQPDHAAARGSAGAAAPGRDPAARARSRSRRSRTARPARTPAPPSAGRSARCRARRRSRAGRPAAPTRRAPRAGSALAARATAAPSACGSRRPRPRSPGTTTSPCSASSAGTGRPRRRAARASEGRSPRGRSKPRRPLPRGSVRDAGCVPPQPASRSRCYTQEKVMRTAVRQGGAPPFRLRRARARTASAGRMCECTYILRMVGWRIAPGPRTVNSPDKDVPLALPLAAQAHTMRADRRRRISLPRRAACRARTLPSSRGSRRTSSAASSTTTRSVVTTTSDGATPAPAGPRRPSRSRSRSAPR